MFENLPVFFKSKTVESNQRYQFYPFSYWEINTQNRETEIKISAGFSVDKVHEWDYYWKPCQSSLYIEWSSKFDPKYNYILYVVKT